jgi:hypothetical protein
VFIRVAADALDWCGASRADPLPLEGLRERFLPECTFRGRENTKLQYAVLAAAALHGGTEPDLGIIRRAELRAYGQAQQVTVGAAAAVQVAGARQDPAAQNVHATIPASR